MARKASNGFGSIRKKTVNGRTYFEGRYTDPATHKQKSVSAPTEKECREKMQRVLASIVGGTYVAPSKKTVGVWMDEWLRDREGIEESTKKGPYEKAIRLYIKPAIGDIQLQDLRRVHCQGFVHDLSHRERPLSPKTIRDAVGVLSAAMERAVQLELIPKNPAKGLDLPRYDKKPPKVMESDTQEAFEAAIQDSSYRNIFLTGLHTGARISEVLGLQWKNIDFQTGEIKICGQLERKRGESLERGLKETTKSHRVRTIIVPPFVVEILKAEKRKQNEWRLKAGQYWKNEDGLVFTREDGSPMPHTTVSNSFKRIAARIGKPDISLHTLRHTFITDELRNGETDIKTISSSIGHSSIAITGDVYAASTNEMKRAAAERRQEAYERQKRNA